MARPESNQVNERLFGAFLRVTWMLGANAGVFFSILLIATETDGRFTWRDILPWAFVAVAIAARYLDITKYEGATAEGEPATLRHLKRHALKLTAFSAFAWGLAHIWAAR